MTTHFTVTCPVCGYQMDSHSAVGDHEDAVPDNGDWSMCISCGELLVYRRTFGKLTLRVPTEAERAEALTDPVVTNVLLAYRDARDKHPEHWPIEPKDQP